MAREHYETLQQVFDDAYCGLAAQGFAPSTDGDGFCAYRGENGRACAIGHCIPDGLYKPSFEECGLHVVRDHLAGLFGVRVGENALIALQKAHDRCAQDNVPMAAQLEEYARCMGLTVPDISSAA